MGSFAGILIVDAAIFCWILETTDNIFNFMIHSSWDNSSAFKMLLHNIDWVKLLSSKLSIELSRHVCGHIH